MRGEPQQLRGPNPAIGGGLDLERQQARGPGRAIQDLGKVRPAYAKPSRHLCDGPIEGVSVLRHDLSIVCDTTKSSGDEIASVSTMAEAVGMNTWPQRPVFQAAVLTYRKAHGLSPKQMADRLDVKPSYLHNLLYDKRVWPSLDVVQKAAGVLGMSITDLADDPGALVEGAPDGASDVDRFMLKAMGSDLTKLTNEQKQSAMEAWRAIVRGYVKQ